MSFVGRFVKSAFRTFGFELQRTDSALVESAVLREALERAGPDVVIDVGASSGQYILLLRKIGYAGSVVAFEPLPDEHAKLTRLSSRDVRLTVAQRTAVGNSRGTIPFFVAANSVSSSFKPMSALHREAAPYSAPTATIEVPVGPLDELIREVGVNCERPFVKIDTQGAELDVLKGGKNIFARASGVQVEMSFEPLYEGQARVSEIVGRLADHGLELVGMIPGFRDPRSRRLLQADGVFLRR